MTYLDANASEPLRPAARAAVLAALDQVGNPSSVHGTGRAARRILDRARQALAAGYGVAADDVVFTSGGTEANALAIVGLRGARRVIVGATEHDAVRQAAPDATVLPVDPDGVVCLVALEQLLMVGPALVCVMAANNETGTRQPLSAVAALCARHGALLHVDAVQSRVAFDMRALGATSVALSAHKMGGPLGAGALLLAGADPAPLIRGGGQERGRRGGTPALPAIAGFAAVVGADWPDLMPLRDAIERAAVAQGAIVLGGPDRLPNTSCLALPGMRADAQVIALDLAGVQVSAGAACSSGTVGESHVLRAMGSDWVGQAIRVSLPWSATTASVDAFTVAYARLCGRVDRVLLPG